MSAEPVRVGVVGLGYWGPNLARNFDGVPGCELTWVCDASQEARERVAPSLHDARVTAELDELLADPRLAERAVEAARAAQRVLMVGHLLEYHPGVLRLKEIADSGELGEIRYIYSNRLNLGVLREEENALWSLGAHDVSVLLALAGEEPHEVEARGESYMQPGIEDVVFCFLRFPSGLSAHLHLSWLDPHKERRFTVVGSRRMATFDDMELERKVTVYDKGFDERAGSYGEYITRSGDTWSPRIPNTEPLRAECGHFVACVRDGATPRSDGESGLRVVRVLEALQDSLESSRRSEAHVGGA